MAKWKSKHIKWAKHLVSHLYGVPCRSLEPIAGDVLKNHANVKIGTIIHVRAIIRGERDIKLSF